eukprot:76445-Chlamydomonas_euryale.AAC.3
MSWVGSPEGVVLITHHVMSHHVITHHHTSHSMSSHITHEQPRVTARLEVCSADVVERDFQPLNCSCAQQTPHFFAPLNYFHVVSICCKEKARPIARRCSFWELVSDRKLIFAKIFANINLLLNTAHVGPPPRREVERNGASSVVKPSWFSAARTQVNSWCTIKTLTLTPYDQDRRRSGTLQHQCATRHRGRRCQT